MRSPARHIIQRQTVWVDQPFLAFGVQERLSAYCRYQLPGLLESLFDRVADANTVIRLDTLDIDAGTLPLTDFENQLTQQISQQLEQELNRLLNNPQPSDGPVERYSRADLIGQQFYFFLQHGYLPPWADATAIGQISAWLISSESAPFRPKLLDLLHQQSTVISRLIAHCTDEALMHLCSPTTPLAGVGQLRYLFDCLHQEIGQLPRILIRERYWSAVFRKIETNDSPANGFISEGVLQRFYLSLYQLVFPSLTSSVPTTSTKPLTSTAPLTGNELYTFFQKLSKAVRQGTQGMPANERDPFIDSLNDLRNQLIQSKTERSRPGSSPGDDPARQTNSVDSANPPTDAIQPNQPVDPSTNQPITRTDLLNETDPTQAPLADIDSKKPLPAERDNSDTGEKALTSSATTEWRETTTLTEGEEIYVSLAGIVLLHPFLSILFTELKLIENRAWVSEEASVKGAQVLAYLATGADYCPEYSLPLIKLLCGLPFETFVPPDMLLTDTEKQSTIDVLEAIISHWQALGNTSAAGLRESFLQREGKLTVVEGGWRLTVERKTIDILLNRLPWGFSMIKLPWMPDLLFVDWT
jgi:hypothetical protein